MQPNADSAPNEPVKDSTVFTVKGLMFASVYVDDFRTGYDFYTRLLGLEKEYDMGDLACYLKLNDELGIYLQGGNRRGAPVSEDSARASFGLWVSSIDALWDRLRTAGVRTIQDAPKDMGGMYWFQFFDPAGNLLEAVGEK